MNRYEIALGKPVKKEKRYRRDSDGCVHEAYFDPNSEDGILHGNYNVIDTSALENQATIMGLKRLPNEPDGHLQARILQTIRGTTLRRIDIPARPYLVPKK